MRTGRLDHFGEYARVLKHRARSQMVFVKRLILAILLEQRLFEHFFDAHFSDIGVGIVDEDTWFDVTVGVDMHVIFAACDTTVNEFTVVLEIDGDDGFPSVYTADFANAMDHILTLFRREQEIERRVGTDRHIVEVPDESCAIFDD